MNQYHFKRYEVIVPNFGETWGADAREVYGHTHDEAARIAVSEANNNSGECESFVGVHVRLKGEDQVRVFDVRTELVPMYQVSEVTAC